MDRTALRTPCFCVNIKKVEVNCDRMPNFFGNQKIKLVPHMKTHKTIEFGKIMTEGQQERKIVVSTLAEAEMYVKCKNPVFDEIIYAYHLTVDKIVQCREIYEHAKKLTLLIENETILEALEKNPPKSGRWNILVEVDHLYARTGLMASDPETLSFIEKVSKASNVNYQGLYLHCGSSYNSKSPEETVNIVKESIQAMKILDGELRKIGICDSILSIGSTPSCSIQNEGLFDGVHEVHPGNYVFYDAQQYTLGSCRLDDIAGTVLTRVIAHYPKRNTVVIDCGWEGLSSEKPNIEEYYERYGYARVKNYPQLKLLKMSQEVGIVTTNDGSQIDFEEFKVGKEIELFPWHSCATAAMHGKYFIYEGENFDKVLDVVTPCRGW